MTTTTTISTPLLRTIQAYLEARADQGDDEARQLLVVIQSQTQDQQWHVTNEIAKNAKAETQSSDLPSSEAALRSKSAKRETQTTNPRGDFQVGDRVRVSNERPQYGNLTGTVEQVISVSCRVQLDNGWSAFLPHQYLEKLP